MINEHFAILAALFPLVGSAIYAWETLQGKTQPNRISWLLWSIAPLIAFAAEVVQHTNFEVALLTFSVGFGPLLVVAASFIAAKAYWRVTRFDLVCGGISLLALLMWAVTGKGDVAIFFSIFSDLFAAVPTIVKSYTHPKSESVWAFIASTIGAAITLLTIKQGNWNFASYAYPAYILLVTVLISGLIIIPRPTKVVIEGQ